MIKAIRACEVPHKANWADGALFFGLAVLAGAAAGFFGFAVHGSGAWARIDLVPWHGFLIEFVALPVALIGGLGRWLVPSRLGVTGMALPGVDRLAALLLGLAIVLLILCAGTKAGDAGALGSAAILMWAVGLFGIATGSVVTILEDRRESFRRLTPFLWSQLLGASGILLVTPLIAARVLNELLIGASGPFHDTAFITLCRFPFLALVTALSLGAAVDALPRHDGPVTAVAEPVALALMATGVPLLWAHAALHGASVPGFMQPLVLVVSTVAFGLLTVAGLWRAHVGASPGLGWALAVFLFCALGWIFPAGNFSGGAHPAVVFGGLCAAFSGCYAWARKVEGAPVPVWFEMLHLALCVAGALCMLSGTVPLAGWGTRLMELALLCMMPLGVAVFRLRLLGSRRRAA